MRRSALLVLPAALAVVLAGCAAPAPTPVAAGPGDGWKYYGIQGGTGGTGGTATGEIGYDSELPTGTTVEWTDPFLTDTADFTVESPDDGAGRWAYTDVADGCVLSFYQTAIDGVDPIGDESARSEAVLATFLGWDTSELDGYTFDVPIAVSGGATFDARAIEGTDDDGSDWITFARSFDVSNQAVALDITCPQGYDARTELDSLTPDYVAARIS